MAWCHGKLIQQPVQTSFVGRHNRRQNLSELIGNARSMLLKCVDLVPCVGRRQSHSLPKFSRLANGERKPMLWDGPGWGPAQTKRFLEYGRDWKSVLRFYQQLVAGEVSLRDLGVPSGEEVILGENWRQKICESGGANVVDSQGLVEQRTIRGCERITYKVGLSYYGPHFHGWACQKERRTVEKVLREKIREILPDANILVATSGRTDRAVSSCAQVVSFYGWRSLPSTYILNAFNSIAPGKLRAWWAEPVPRKFHATFSANWRRYIYLFPMRKGDPKQWGHIEDQMKDVSLGYDLSDMTYEPHHPEDFSQVGEIPEVERVDLSDVDIEKANQLLQKLEGQPINYYSFARDTPKGKECTCTLIKGRAFALRLTGDDGGVDVMCVELVGNRFLRKMVRVLVSTTIREASWGNSREGSVEALLEIAAAKNRVMSASAAPSVGLCFAGVAYDSYE
ncbi:hypothetical protein BSKO_12244 [Bryopsis sp. KO-2023]|nr:hypothetical protein BSKO_12244 [Bryopsis sp. KO-2023]